MNYKPLTIKQNMLWNSVGSLVYFGCQWLMTILVVRMSPSFEDAGVLALGMAVSNIVMPLGYFRNRALQISDEDNKFTPGQYVTLRAITNLASLAFGAAYIWATCPETSFAPVFAYCVYASNMVLADVFHGVDQKALRMDFIGKSQIARGAASLIVFFAAFGATSSLTATFAVMAVVTYAIVFAYDVPKAKRLDPSIGLDFDRKGLWGLFVLCIPLAIGSLLCNATTSIPRQFLDDMYGSSALGAYASVAAPVAIIQMAASYIYGPMLNVFSKMNHDKDAKGFARLFVKMLSAILALVACCLIASELAGAPVLVLLFGREIASFTCLLSPLIVNVGLVALTWFCSDLLTVVRDIKGSLLANLIPFVVSVALSHPMLSAFGLNGATLALIVGFSVSAIFCLARLGLQIAKGLRRPK